MDAARKFPIPPAIAQNALITKQHYQALYQQSIQDPNTFWAAQGQCLDWISPYHTIKNTSFTPGNISIRWFEDGTLNLTANCLDRHLASKGQQTAIIWESDDSSQSETLTYQQLYDQVCRFANVLKSLGLRKGDVVAIYMPMVPETAVAMLACARIGVVHSVIFGGFSPEAIADRLVDCNARVVITADEGIRAGRRIPLKNNIDRAIALPAVENRVEQVIVLQHTGGSIAWQEGRDLWWHRLMAHSDAVCPPVEMAAEDPLFILYTSGSTGKPKGVLHTTGGYLVYVTLTFRYVFDYRDSEIYWCTADVGWITGHSYLLYRPLSNGATTLMFEGVPNYPQANRLAQIIDKHQVNILYTAPTLIRALMAEGDNAIQGTSRASLRLLGSVGEPINPEAWLWYHHKIGDHPRFEQTYFAAFAGCYFSGDGARRDQDGYYWITGRVDDVLNVSGHRLGTAELESALVAHPKIAEAAVVGIPHDIKGQAIYAYITLNHDATATDELAQAVCDWMREQIGAIAIPAKIHWTDALPKTRSGKIMRRLLRKIASGDTENLGDISTLADPSVIEKLLAEKQ